MAQVLFKIVLSAFYLVSDPTASISVVCMLMVSATRTIGLQESKQRGKKSLSQFLSNLDSHDL